MLAHHVLGVEVWAFGSRVAGQAHEGSDLDLVLRNTVDPTRPVAGWTRLVEALQSSALPMLVEVHDGALIPPEFQLEIERRYVVVQPAPQRQCADAQR